MWNLNAIRYRAYCRLKLNSNTYIYEITFSFMHGFLRKISVVFSSPELLNLRRILQKIPTLRCMIHLILLLLHSRQWSYASRSISTMTSPLDCSTSPVYQRAVSGTWSPRSHHRIPCTLRRAQPSTSSQSTLPSVKWHLLLWYFNTGGQSEGKVWRTVHRHSVCPSTIVNPSKHDNTELHAIQFTELSRL